ncbi:hypothetical protein CB1_000877010 [Camelus ferus]|nr:hypothetical protein CB1_000877010 [Camelus ferus]
MAFEATGLNDQGSVEAALSSMYLRSLVKRIAFRLPARQCFAVEAAEPEGRQFALLHSTVGQSFPAQWMLTEMVFQSVD